MTHDHMYPPHMTHDLFAKVQALVHQQLNLVSTLQDEVNVVCHDLQMDEDEVNEVNVVLSLESHALPCCQHVANTRLPCSVCHMLFQQHAIRSMFCVITCFICVI